MLLISKCKYCNEIFQSKIDLQRHINDTHPTALQNELTMVEDTEMDDSDLPSIDSKCFNWT